MAPGMSAPWSMPRPKLAGSGRAFVEVADLLSTQPQPQVITMMSVRRRRSLAMRGAVHIFEVEEVEGAVVGAGAGGVGVLSGCILRTGFEARLDGGGGGGEVCSKLMTDSEPPAEPAEGVAEGTDFAGFGGVAGLDGNEIDLEPGVKKTNDHFGFDFETISGAFDALPRSEIDETEAAL